MRFNQKSTSFILAGASLLIAHLAFANLTETSDAGSLVDYYGHMENGKPAPYAPMTAEEEAAAKAALGSPDENLTGEMFLSGSFGGGNSYCSLKQLKSVRLSQVKNVREQLHCKLAGPCQVKMVLDQVAAENGIPRSFVYAIAYTESHWSHWNDYGACKTNPSDDWGLMQVNRQFQYQTNWRRVVNDPLYNARFAVGVVLRWDWNYVRSEKPGLSGEELYRSVYAVYNGGPSDLNRPWRASYVQDSNFLNYYESRPWRKSIASCR